MKPVGKMYKIYLSILIVWICYAFVCMKLIMRERERACQLWLVHVLVLFAVISLTSDLVLRCFYSKDKNIWGEGEPGKGVSIQSADLHDILLVSENKFLIYVYQNLILLITEIMNNLNSLDKLVLSCRNSFFYKIHRWRWNLTDNDNEGMQYV